jgi:hypothetical protein
VDTLSERGWQADATDARTVAALLCEQLEVRESAVQRGACSHALLLLLITSRAFSRLTRD